MCIQAAVGWPSRSNMHWLTTPVLLALLAVTVVSVPTGDKTPTDTAPAAKVTEVPCEYGLEECPQKKCGPGAQEKDKDIICFFVDWADVWKDPGKFYPENIPDNLCTHVSYAFGVVDNNPTGLSLPSDKQHNDETEKWYERITEHKKRGVKVLLAVGWGNTKATVENRKNFVASVVKLLQTYNFDGLDIYFGPVTESKEVDEGTTCPKDPADKEELKNLVELVRELKTAFNGQYLLAATKKKMESCFDFEEMCSLADWVGVGAFNKHHYTDGVTGAEAPMCGTNGEKGLHEILKYILEKKSKCPPSKIIIGSKSTFAKSFTLSEPAQEDRLFGASVKGPGTPGAITGYKDGFLAYHEVCKLINDDNYSWGFSKTQGSYAWKGDQFISFQRQKDFARTACLINQNGLRGISVWTMDFDDWSNRCGCGHFPLLTTLNKHLRCSETELPPPNMPDQCKP